MFVGTCRLPPEVIAAIGGWDNGTVLKRSYQSGVSLPGLQFCGGGDPQLPSRLSMWAARWHVKFRTMYPHLIHQLYPFLKVLEGLVEADKVLS